jgi:hypothetical protein
MVYYGAWENPPKLASYDADPQRVMSTSHELASRDSAGDSPPSSPVRRELTTLCRPQGAGVPAPLAPNESRQLASVCAADAPKRSLPSDSDTYFTLFLVVHSDREKKSQISYQEPR